MCTCCLILTLCDPDEGVEGGPAAKGNLVMPSPTLISSSEEEEEEEEETDKAMGGQTPAGGKQAGGGSGGQPRGKGRGGAGGDELGQVGGS